MNRVLIGVDPQRRLQGGLEVLERVGRVLHDQVELCREGGGEVNQVFRAQVDDRDRLVQEGELRAGVPRRGGVNGLRGELQAGDDRPEVQVPEARQCVQAGQRDDRDVGHAHRRRRAGRQ